MLPAPLSSSHSTIQLTHSLSYNQYMTFAGDGTTLVVHDSTQSRGFQVYELDSSSWVKKGDILTDTSSPESFWGDSAAISDDGNFVALAGSDSVIAYFWNTDILGWDRIGQRLTRNEPDGEFDIAMSVELSSDGYVLAVGYVTPSEVIIYDLLPSNGELDIEPPGGFQWIPRGDGSIVSSDVDSTQWYAISLSGDGNTIAVGIRAEVESQPSLFDLELAEAESVKIFQWGGAAWKQVGVDITSGVFFSDFGGSLDFSADASIIAIGSPTGKSFITFSSIFFEYPDSFCV